MLFIYNLIALLIWTGGDGPEVVERLNGMIPELNAPGFVWYFIGLVIMALLERALRD